MLAIEAAYIVSVGLFRLDVGWVLGTTSLNYAILFSIT